MEMRWRAERRRGPGPSLHCALVCCADLCVGGRGSLHNVPAPQTPQFRFHDDGRGGAPARPREVPRGHAPVGGVWGKPFFSGLHTLPQGGVCLPAFLEILGALSGITLPPPPGGGRPRVGWPFLGKTFVSKIFILSLGSMSPDLVSTLAVLHYTCGPLVVGSNPDVVVA